MTCIAHKVEIYLLTHTYLIMLSYRWRINGFTTDIKWEWNYWSCWIYSRIRILCLKGTDNWYSLFLWLTVCVHSTSSNYYGTGTFNRFHFKDNAPNNHIYSFYSNKDILIIFWSLKTGECDIVFAQKKFKIYTRKEVAWLATKVLSSIINRVGSTQKFLNCVLFHSGF